MTGADKSFYGAENLRFAHMVAHNGAVILPFLPFAIVSLVHLGALLVDNSALDHATKPLLMPALLLGFLIAIPIRRGVVARLGSIAIFLSWVGDVLLGSTASVGFILGLGAFLIAHGVLIVLFLGALRTHRMPWFALILVLWFALLIALLAPSLGTLLVPVIAYGLVLGFLCAAGLGSTRLVAVGGVFILVSDTVLALKMFLPEFSLWQHDFLIMLTYIVGQLLVCLGAIFVVKSTAPDVVAQEGSLRKTLRSKNANRAGTHQY